MIATTRHVLVLALALAACGDNKPMSTGVTLDTFPPPGDGSGNDDDGDDADDSAETTVTGTSQATTAPLTSGEAPTSGQPVTSSSDPDTTAGPSSDPDTTAGSSSDPDTTADPSSDSSPYCGDGNADADESCDTDDLHGQGCTDFGYLKGQLKCNKDCTFDILDCNRCGNGEVNVNEACDCRGDGCSYQELNGLECVIWEIYPNIHYDGGNLGCSADCKKFDLSDCAWCGDDMATGDEVCDGTDLNGKTCQSLGYSGGTLKCDSDCKHNVGSCNF